MSTERLARRSLLGAGVGGLVGWVAAALGRPTTASAAGDPIVVGGTYNDAAATTAIRNFANDEDVLEAYSDGAGIGLYANSTDKWGVYGTSGTGVGVYGKGNNGVGVRAASVHDVALEVEQGRVRFSSVSGVAVIPAGARSVVVTPGVEVTPGAFVLLTPRANLGSRSLWYTTRPAAGTFRVRMGSARTTPTPVAWLLIG